MGRVEAIVGWMSKLLLAVGGAAILLMMLHITADVAGKYFFNQPIVGTLEFVSRYYMVACVFLPIAYVQLHRQHLMVELFTMKLSPRRTALVDGIVALFGVVYAAVLAWLVFGQAMHQTGRREFFSITYFDLPVWPSRWFLPLSFGLLALVMLVQAISDLRFGLTGRARAPSATDNPQDAQ